MLLSVGGLPVVFPYEYIYPEQHEYMRELKRTLDARGHGLIEMPSGTGKTATILSLLLSYNHAHPERCRPIVYCTRTVPEVDKALGELRRIVEARRSAGFATDDFLGVGLASRRHICVNERVIVDGVSSGRAVDGRCHSLTASYMRAKATNIEDVCEYYENIEAMKDKFAIPMGVYTLDELKAFGKQNKLCPYFMARAAMSTANVIIYSYHYLLDPKVSALVSRNLPRDAVVVFDEAHNIDNVAIDALSIELEKPAIDGSTRAISTLNERVAQLKERDAQKLQSEYEKLLEGLRKAGEERAADRIMASPVLPDDLLINSAVPEEAMVPGDIRRAEHFLSFLKRFADFLKSRFLKVGHVISESPAAFLLSLKQTTLIERRPLRFCTERLASLAKTLELSSGDVSDIIHLERVAAFATLVGTYQTGFTVLFEPRDDDSATPARLTLACLDATIAMAPVFQRFSSVLITSGTLSPLDMYPRILNFVAARTVSLSTHLPRDPIRPLIVTRGSDQVAISSRFEIRSDPAVVRNYGLLLLDLSKTVPDGLVAFFPSYLYLEAILSMWQESGLMDELLAIRPLFIETPDSAETALALANFRKACDSGLGGLLLSVARGKVSEGIDFEGHYGRAVVLFGIPYQYTESRILKSRLEYLRATYNIRETDFLTFDALRHAAQCLGRGLRGKSDYGLMIMADKRYARTDKRSRLPRWISDAIQPGHANLSTDQAVLVARRFYRDMAQPLDMKAQVGYALLTTEDVSKKEAEWAEAERVAQGYVVDH